MLMNLWFQGLEYEIVDDSQEHWWKAKDSCGYVKPFLVLLTFFLNFIPLINDVMPKFQLFQLDLLVTFLAIM